MPDREKVIQELESMRNYHRGIGNNITADIAEDALALLKEQANAYDYLQKQFFEVQDKLIERPQIVRCKDCKHRLLPTGETRAECMARAGWFPVDDDWFCADGERK